MHVLKKTLKYALKCFFLAVKRINIDNKHLKQETSN